MAKRRNRKKNTKKNYKKQGYRYSNNHNNHSSKPQHNKQVKYKGKPSPKYNILSQNDVKQILSIDTPLWTVIDNGIPNSDR